MEPKLIKIDRNGSKHFEGLVTCDRCSGRGWFAVGVCNGQLVPSHLDNAVCWKCLGAGKVRSKWVERTPEYQAKLDAKRQARQEAQRAEWEAEQAKINAEREAREAAERAEREAEEERRRAQKAISQHIGQVGERLRLTVTYERSGSWEVRAFSGFGTETMYTHTFKDADGNVLVWKTSRGLGWSLEDGRGWKVPEPGDTLNLVGTVKEHTEYKDEKQTVLTRCKITE